MYLDHFGLNQPPFKITPNTGFFYAGGNRGAILDTLLYAIVHGEGIVKVTGEIGSGKTMLCRMLESMLPEGVETIYLPNPSINRDEILFVIAGELGLITEGQRTTMIIRELQRRLIENHAQGRQMVIIVDEAQAMPLESLEEIRLLSNLETETHKLLQIVLFGQPDLDDNLAQPQIRQLKERITHNFVLPPLQKGSLADYLMFRMRAAGYHGPDIFNQDAIKRIAAASQGITRRINILADKALLAAFSDNTHNILPKHVKAAIKDSEFTTPRSGLPLKQIGLTAALLVLGIALGAGWQHFASLPPKAGAAESVPAPTPAAEQAPRQSLPAENPPTPVSAPSPAHDPLQQRLAATQSWLANEDGAHFTVQLMLLTDTGTEPRLGSALTRLGREFGMAQIYVYPTRTRITANRQFNITFGSFSSRKEALAALAALPAGYLANQPALRTVKGIRDEIAEQTNTATTPSQI